MQGFGSTTGDAMATTSTPSHLPSIDPHLRGEAGRAEQPGKCRVALECKFDLADPKGTLGE